MRPFIRSWYRAGLIGGAALALSLVPANARGQQGPDRSAPATETAPPGQQNTNPDFDRMDQFLNDHKDIDKDLRSKPSLITDQKYLDHHKDLRSFLNDHPEMQRAFSQNPAYFTHREDRFNARDARTNQDRDRDAGAANSQNGNAANNNPNRDQDRDQNYTDRDRDRDANGQNPGLRNGEAAQLDRFLDDHQQIDKDLRANPSLADNKTYLDQHQDLRTFLNDHPDVRDQFAKNPSLFMQRENRFDAREAQPTRNQDQDRDRDARAANSQNGYAANSNPDRDQDRDRYADAQNPTPDQDRDRNFADRDQYRDRDQMDQFLDDHKDIDKDLRKNPSLVNDQKYLDHHRDLRYFCDEHPQVRREFAENPSFFMNRDNRFESREVADRIDANRRASNAAPNLTDKQSAELDRFLDKHKDVDRDLSANPSLCNDQKYLHNHKDLRVFLDKNPEVRTELANNSSYFAQRHERMEQHHLPANATKPAPAKPPIEQHEATTPATTH
ncbi:MAG TPA: hypothetical protein VIY66_00145 [Candidatus Acidoferrales bacterium]